MVVTDGGHDSELPTELSLVRFANCADVRIPDAYMRIDEAINLLGVRKHPNFWGRYQAFSWLPLAKDAPLNKLHMQRLEEKKGIWKERIFIDSYDDDDFVGVNHARRFFFVVCRNLLRAWENKQFPIHLIHPTAGLLPPMPEASLHMQYDDIFRYGRGHAAVEPAHMRYLIAVIDRKVFMAWLKQGAWGYETPDDIAPTVKKKPIHERVWRPVVYLIMQKQVKVTSDWLWKILLAGREPDVASKAAFLKVVWGPLDDRVKCRGRVSNTQQKAMSELENEAKTLVENGWQGMRKASR